MMHYTRAGSVTLAAASGGYLVGGLAAAAGLLVFCGAGVYLLSARRRSRDRAAARR
jgi:hypothetical protein